MEKRIKHTSTLGNPMNRRNKSNIVRVIHRFEGKGNLQEIMEKIVMDRLGEKKPLA